MLLFQAGHELCSFLNCFSAFAPYISFNSKVHSNCMFMYLHVIIKMVHTALL